MIFFSTDESFSKLLCMFFQFLISFIGAGQLVQTIVQHFPLAIIPQFDVFEVLFELLHFLFGDFFVLDLGLVFFCQFLKVYLVAIQLIFYLKALLFQCLYLGVSCFQFGLVLHLGLYQFFYLFLGFFLSQFFPFLGLKLHRLYAIFVLFFCRNQSLSDYLYLLVSFLYLLLQFFSFLLQAPTLLLDLSHFLLQMVCFFNLSIQFFKFRFMLLLKQLKISAQLIELFRIFIDSFLKLMYMTLFFCTFLGSLMAILLAITSQCSFHLFLIGQLILQSFNLQTQGLNNRLLDNCLDELFDAHDGELLSQRALLQGLEKLVLQNQGVKTLGKFQHYYSKRQQLTDIVQTSKRQKRHHQQRSGSRSSWVFHPLINSCLLMMFIFFQYLLQESNCQFSLIALVAFFLFNFSFIDTNSYGVIHSISPSFSLLRCG